MQTLSLKENKAADTKEVREGEHVLAEFEGPSDGPSLIIFGGIHGNEPSGVRALKRVASELKKKQIRVNGRIVFLAGNTRALNRDVRFLDTDLNRHWTEEKIARNRVDGFGGTVEDKEQAELLVIIDRVLDSARNEVFALDLHSTSSESTPFAMVGDTIRNRTFAEKFPVTFLLGIEEQLDGTILEYLNELGVVTLGFEAGQHTTGEADRNQEALIWAALRNSGLVPPDAVEEKYFDYLKKAMGRQQIIEIRHRHAIASGDGFSMQPGYRNFQPIRKGETLAQDQRGPITAAEGGMILMPLYQDQGNDGFFLGREVAKFWLWLSRVLRSLHIGRYMRILPGVSRDPADEESLIVNTRVARILPLQIFHLLGFRKRRWRRDKLIVSRRHHDTVSPFINRALAED